ASDASQSGKLVIEAKGISKTFGDRPVVKDFSIRIQRGDRLGLVGANGAGKTTLLKMLTGVLGTDTGSIRLGTNLEIATLDQNRASLDPNETLAHFLTDGRGESVVVNGEERHVVSYMKDFLFKPEQARTPVRELSGGERARLVLARLLSRPANLLVLDEPTNDLDMETLDLLQELVEDFPGTVILVSHDRDFLDRTVTSTIAPEGNGNWIEYAGGYSDMLTQRKGQELERRKARPQEDRASKSGGAEPQRQPSRKLSYKQKYALETLPGQIDDTTKKIAALEEKLADPALYARDFDAFERFSAELEKLRHSLARMEEEWLELYMLREEFEG